MKVSELTRQYWIDAVLGWAEARLMPPQYEECKQALHETHEDEIRQAIIQMVKLGNELDWHLPIDQAFVDALNNLRLCIDK